MDMNTLAWYDQVYLLIRTKICNESIEKACNTNTCKYLQTLVLVPFLILLFFGLCIFLGIAGIIGAYKLLTVMLGMPILDILIVIGVSLLAVIITFVITIIFIGILGVAVVFLLSSMIAIYNKVTNTNSIEQNSKTSRFVNTMSKCISDWHNRVCTKFKVGENV